MNIKRILTIVLLSLITFKGEPQGVSLRNLVPDPARLGGWHFSRKPECYQGDELEKLNDGNAPIFKEYHYLKVIAAQYVEDNGSKMQLEIYEMDSDSSAYGIFSSMYNSHEVNQDIGLFSIENDQYVAFVKSKYYVNITWVLRKATSQISMMKLARTVEEGIPAEGGVPWLVSRLGNIKRTGIPVYFKGNIALSNVYYFDFRDQFNINQGLAFKDDNVIKIVFVYNKSDDVEEIFSGINDFIDNSKRFRDPGMIYQGFTCSDNKGNRLVFRLGTGFITVVIALKPDVQLMSEQGEFFTAVEAGLK